MRIGDFNLDEKVLLIAEIGNNHEGSFEVACNMVETAAACGVDAVKFQTFRTEHYVSHKDEARFARLKSFELSYQQFTELADLARRLGMLFLSTPFDLQSAEFLGEVADGIKIASGDNNFFPLVERVVATGKPVIVSTGVTELQQVQELVRFVRDAQGRSRIEAPLALLHCVSAYPTSPEDANLRAIGQLAAATGCTVGYSDHTQGVEAALLAVALGARIVEKHFTLDKNFSDFRDHQLSADPEEMRLLVSQLDLAQKMLGSGVKTLQPGEAPVASAIRRSIVAAGDYPADHVLQLSDLTWIRPGGGIPPGEEAQLVGKALRRPVTFGETLSLADLA